MNKEILQDEHGDYCLIPLTKGQFAKVEPDDYERIMQWKWYAHWSKYTNTFRAQRNDKTEDGKRFTVLMHREVMRAEGSIKVDHKRHDTLDNRQGQLRLATSAQNNQNARMRKSNTSGLKGVFHQVGTKRRRERWSATIMVNKKVVYLGKFRSPEEAHAAYKKAADELHGEFANY